MPGGRRRLDANRSRRSSCPRRWSTAATGTRHRPDGRGFYRNERLRRRKEIRSVLADIAGGSHALSELDFTALVVRQFGLPEPSRLVPRLDGQGRRRWLDVCWERAGLVVEIDGAAHIDVLQYWDDMDRGNDLTLEHHRVLRFPAWVIFAIARPTSPPRSEPLRAAGYAC